VVEQPKNLNKLFLRAKTMAKDSVEEAIRSRYFPEVWYLTEDWLALVKPKRVLEVGCGQGLLTEALVKSGWDLTSTDPSVTALQKVTARLGELAKNVKFEQCQGEKIPVAPSSFEAVVSMNLLEFNYKPLRTLMQIEKILVPGGRAVIVTFNRTSPWGLASVARHIRPNGENRRAVRCMSREEFLGLLRASRLKVHELKERACFLPAPAKGLQGMKLPVAGAFVALVSKRKKKPSVRTEKKTPPT
jgi:SAM-dependent methyltransferase